MKGAVTVVTTDFGDCILKPEHESLVNLIDSIRRHSPRTNLRRARELSRLANAAERDLVKSYQKLVESND